VTPTELQDLLTSFASERLGLLERHEAGARSVGNYDINNAYQYVVNREETHVSWLRDALVEFGAALPSSPAPLAVPAASKPGKKAADPALYRDIIADDARQLGAFVERWRPRVAGMTHARHRTMLNVVLGESLEHKRLFDDAVAGSEDLLGRRTGGVARQGTVLPTRWQE